jgi:hypothetical protein
MHRTSLSAWSARLSLLGLIALSGASSAGCSDEGEPGPSTGTSSGASSAGAKKIAEVGCNDDSECESNVCFKGNAQSFCTFKCTTETAANVCVAPLTGTCNKQGFCKRD